MSDEIEMTSAGWEALLQKAERERDEATKDALYYKTRYELLKDSIDIFKKDGTCLDCGAPLQAVRPGKEQCNCCDNIRHLETALEETAKLAATLKRERDEARIQEDIHLKNCTKLVDLAHRMLAEMEYVQWLSTAAVFRDELEQIKST